MANLTISGVRFSYVHVFEPYDISNSGKEPKFSVQVIIPKSNKKALKQIDDALEATKKDEKTLKKFGGKIPKNLKTFLRDGDIEREDKPEYANCYFFNASSTNRPNVVDMTREPIVDPNEFYSGCWGAFNGATFAYSTQGSNGISVGLNNLMKMREDKRLGGGGLSAEAAFADIEDDDKDLAGLL